MPTKYTLLQKMQKQVSLLNDICLLAYGADSAQQHGKEFNLFKVKVEKKG